MNATEQTLICLLKSAVSGKAVTVPEDFDSQQLLDISRRHNVQPLVFAGGLQCGLDKKSILMQRLFREYCMYSARIRRQTEAFTRLMENFQARQIHYMPVKGCVMRPLYPRPEMRTMGDADILIRKEQYKDICQIMRELGYVPGDSADHCDSWDSEDLTVELHRRLIPAADSDLYTYYGDGWHGRTIDNGFRHDMYPEDAYIYLFAHFSKHFRGSGIGCRHMLDLWIFQKTYPGMDMEYVNGELEKLHLLEFHENIQKVLGYWFRGEKPNEKTNFISQYILNGGLWGDARRLALSKGVRGTAEQGSVRKMRWQRLHDTLFLDPWEMKRRYPILNKHPGLLPLAWVRRGFHVLLFRRNRIVDYVDETKATTEKNLAEWENNIVYMGLQASPKAKK